MDNLILVDKTDTPIGVMEKLEAHKLGKLHRAVSVFLFDHKGRILLQKRAAGKYHSAGLWSNTCCSHPRPGEPVAAAAHRRLWEEMGMECDLKKIYSFTYRIEFENGLIENEYDHVFVGFTDANPTLNPDEAEAWEWLAISDLELKIKEHPEMYTYWLGVSLSDVIKASQDETA